jgi:uncharacterized damage-inducible protein DinB
MTTRMDFPAVCEHYFAEYLQKIEHCVALLDEDEVWRRPAAGSNSIGNLLLHLAGNLSLWVLNSLGGEHNERHRSAEFAADRAFDKAEMLERLREVIGRCRTVAFGMTPEALARTLDVQGYPTDGLGALFHAVEHMSYHTGQIIYWTKVLVAGRVEIEFYPQHQGE